MANRFRVNWGIKDLEIALGKIKQYDLETQNNIKKAVQNSTKNIMLGAKRRVRVKTGRLLQHITMTYDENRNIGKVIAKSPHAHLIEFGARGAVETPKNKKALKVRGGFIEKANIPVRKAYPFLRPAFEDEKPNLTKAIEDAIQK